MAMATVAAASPSAVDIPRPFSGHPPGRRLEHGAHYSSPSSYEPPRHAHTHAAAAAAAAAAADDDDDDDDEQNMRSNESRYRLPSLSAQIPLPSASVPPPPLPSSSSLPAIHTPSDKQGTLPPTLHSPSPSAAHAPPSHSGHEPVRDPVALKNEPLPSPRDLARPYYPHPHPAHERPASPSPSSAGPPVQPALFHPHLPPPPMQHHYQQQQQQQQQQAQPVDNRPGMESPSGPWHHDPRAQPPRGHPHGADDGRLPADALPPSASYEPYRHHPPSSTVHYYPDAHAQQQQGLSASAQAPQQQHHQQHVHQPPPQQHQHALPQPPPPPPLFTIASGPLPSPSSDQPASTVPAPTTGPVRLYASSHRVSAARYATSADPRGHIPVYEYCVNGQYIMIDSETNYIHFTGIWKALGHTKADIVRLLDASPELERVIRKVRGGFLKIQGTWMPYEIALSLARRTAWNIRHDLVPLFGPTFPSTCLSPEQPGFGQLMLASSNKKPRRRPPNPTAQQTSCFGPPKPVDFSLLEHGGPPTGPRPSPVPPYEHGHHPPASAPYAPQHQYATYPPHHPHVPYPGPAPPFSAPADISSRPPSPRSGSMPAMHEPPYYPSPHDRHAAPYPPSRFSPPPPGAHSPAEPSSLHRSASLTDIRRNRSNSTTAAPVASHPRPPSPSSAGPDTHAFHRPHQPDQRSSHDFDAESLRYSTGYFGSDTRRSSVLPPLSRLESPRATASRREPPGPPLPPLHAAMSPFAKRRADDSEGDYRSRAGSWSTAPSGFRPDGDGMIPVGSHQTESTGFAPRLPPISTMRSRSPSDKAGAATTPLHTPTSETAGGLKRLRLDPVADQGQDGGGGGASLTLPPMMRLDDRLAAEGRRRMSAEDRLHYARDRFPYYYPPGSVGFGAQEPPRRHSGPNAAGHGHHSLGLRGAGDGPSYPPSTSTPTSLSSITSYYYSRGGPPGSVRRPSSVLSSTVGTRRDSDQTRTASETDELVSPVDEDAATGAAGGALKPPPSHPHEEQHHPHPHLGPTVVVGADDAERGEGREGERGRIVRPW